ncbi:MAG: hypothetical protein M3Y35_05750 [Actinomycetota bacterium]|nr:hypothetical protein [Actinomycetota bacterium]
MPFGSPGERIARLTDTLGLLRDKLPETTIMLAARTADIVAFGWPPTTDTAAALERIDLVLSAAGPQADAIELATGADRHR